MYWIIIIYPHIAWFYTKVQKGLGELHVPTLQKINTKLSMFWWASLKISLIMETLFTIKLNVMLTISLIVVAKSPRTIALYKCTQLWTRNQLKSNPNCWTLTINNRRTINLIKSTLNPTVKSYCQIQLSFFDRVKKKKSSRMW